MKHSIKTTFFSRGTMIAALMSALLGIAAFTAMSPRTGFAATSSASASADSPTTCDPGEFCLGRLHHLSGGLYQNTGNDANLSDNVFLPERIHRVARNSRSAYNHGNAQSNGYNDVIVYDLPNFRGDSACITLGRLLPDLSVWSIEHDGSARYEDWNMRIMSFKWATHAQCTPHGVLVND
jgi:hypothetical protein